MIEPRLELAMLGPMEMSWAGRPVVLASAAARALLAYLAVETGRSHSREQLATLLWPESPQAAAFNNLRQALSRLRQSLPPTLADTVVRTTRQALELDRELVSVDVTRFEDLLADCAVHDHATQSTCDACVARLREAATLYRGEFLQGLLLDKSPAFDEWLLFKREELHRQVLSVLQTLAEAAEAAGDYEAMRRYAARQVAMEPWREDAHMQVMRALVGKGQRAAALAQYETCRRQLAAELGIELSPELQALYARIKAGEPLTNIQHSPAVQDTPAAMAVDWGEAPDVGMLYGRVVEAARLDQWLVQDRCRVVGVLGMGGVGKTVLAATVVRTVATRYERVIWRSLLNAPPFAELIGSVVQSLAGHTLASLPTSQDGLLTLLLEYLRKQRCLLVLDNLESLLEPDGFGRMRVGYEGYATLLHTLAHNQHISCLLFTSRERAQGMARSEADLPWVRTMRLEGLDLAAGEAVLAARGLTNQESEARTLVERYSGHPLALKLIVETIHELFGGDIAEFLRAETPIFDDIRAVLDQQLARLSPLEQELMYWLAIEREATTAPRLRANLAQQPVPRVFLEALRALQRRSLLERVGEGFTLQNVVIEYLTGRLVEGVCDELERASRLLRRPADEVKALLPDTLKLLNSFALMKVLAREYVRQSQVRMLLQPIADFLMAAFGRGGLAAQVRKILAGLRDASPGYAGGNLLNLLLHLGVDVVDFDFSGLTVWQADLRGLTDARLNFRDADLSGSAFTLTFIPHALWLDPNGDVLFAGSGDGAVSLWRAAEGQLQFAFSTPTPWAYRLIFSPDGRFLAGGCLDNTVRLWSVATGETLHILQGHIAVIHNLAFSHDSRFLVSSSFDQSIRLWDLVSGQSLAVLINPTTVAFGLAIRPPTEADAVPPLLASSGVGHTIYLWDLVHKEVVDVLHGHNWHIDCLAFSPDGTLLSSGSQDGMLLLWEVDDRGQGRRIGALEGHSHMFRTLVFHPGGRLLAIASADGTARVWDVHTGQAQHIFHGSGGDVLRVAVRSDGTTLASVGGDQLVRVWDTQSGKLINMLTTYAYSCHPLRFRPDGRQLAVGSVDGRIHLWASSDGRLERTLFGHNGPMRVVVYSPDGRLLASSSADGTIRIWDLGTGRTIRVLHGQKGVLKALAWSPCGRWLAAGGGGIRVIRVWVVPEDVTALAEQPIRVLRGHTDDIETLAFSPDGSLLLSASLDNTARLWSVEQGEEILTFTGHSGPLGAAAFSPRGDLAVTMSYSETVRLWNVATGRVCEGWSDIQAAGPVVAFSPRGDIVAHAVDETVLLLRDLAGTLLHTLRGHTELIRGLDFSPTEPVLVSCGNDGTIRIWDTDSGACLRILRAPGPYVGMNITGVTGITEVQRSALKALGAVIDGSVEESPTLPAYQ